RGTGVRRGGHQQGGEQEGTHGRPIGLLRAGLAPMSWFRLKPRDLGAAARARLERHVWPPELLEALARLRHDGHACYLVGGTVRDVLLDRPGGTVFDVATDRPPAQVIALFPRVEPIGLVHGTVLVVLD